MATAEVCYDNISTAKYPFDVIYSHWHTLSIFMRLNFVVTIIEVQLMNEHGTGADTGL